MEKQHGIHVLLICGEKLMDYTNFSNRFIKIISDEIYGGWSDL